MEIGLKYNLELVEDVARILSRDFWVFCNFTAAMIPKISDPIKFTSNMSIFIDRGECKIEIDLQEYHVKAPSIVNIRQGQILQFENVSDDFNSSLIVLSKQFCDNLFLLLKDCVIYGFISHYQVVKVPEEMVGKFERFYQHILEIFSNSSDPNSYNAMILAIASFFYECGISCYSRVMENLPKSQNRLSEKFISLVQRNFKKERFLDFYANQLDVSAKHLSRMIRNMTGFTAVEWIDRFVILEAKVLLKSTNLTVQQISDELNFPSQSFFGKYFKKHTGQSPKDFRNV